MEVFQLPPINSRNILVTDRVWSEMINVWYDLAERLNTYDINLVVLTSFSKSKFFNNVYILNVDDFEIGMNTLEGFQYKYNFSLYRAIVTERSWYDYTTLTSSEVYSSISFLDKENWVLKYSNALDVLMSKYISLVFENAPDCFIQSLNSYISNFYKIPFYSIELNYYQPDSIWFFDKVNWSSSQIENEYKISYENEIMDFRKQELEDIYSVKKTSFILKKQTWKVKFKSLKRRFLSYEKPSFKNFFVRKIKIHFSNLLIKILINREYEYTENMQFVVFPLHQSPEASLLGITPELADQLNVIRSISFNLPYGVVLLIKEHPMNHLGSGLGFNFFKKLSHLPNVRIIKHGKCSFSTLIKSDNCLCAIGINGTSLFEAMLQKKPSVVLGDPFFKNADYFIKPNSYIEIYNIINDIRNNKFVINEKSRIAIMDAMDKSLYKLDKAVKDQISQYELAINMNSAIVRKIKEFYQIKT